MVWLLFIAFFVIMSVVGNQVFAREARKMFTNAKVYTMNKSNPWADTVVVEGNKFIYVGNKSGAEKYIDDSVEIFDLRGRMVLPGFIESHIHPSFGSLFDGVVILNQDATKEQLLADIKKAVKEHQQDDIIGMMGFKAAMFGPMGPTSAELDAIEKEKPVIILDYGGHSAWVNSKALQIGGINKNTPDPIPGAHFYKRDKAGNPTGWCIEPMSFMPIVYKIGIKIDDVIEGEKKLFPTISAYGFTTLFDAGGIMQVEMYESYARMQKSGQLPFRVFSSYMVSDEKKLSESLVKLKQYSEKYNTPLFKLNTVKILYDGTLEAQSCAMFEDFRNDKGNKGFELFSPAVLASIVEESDNAGYNIHIHAIGDRAISDALAAFEKLKSKKGYTKTRKTICHTQFFMPDTVARFKALRDVVAQTTPVWMTPDSNTLAVAGKESYERQMLFNSLDEAGVKVTFGSDYPVSSGFEGLNPFNEIETGHTRRNIGESDSNYLPPESEKLPIDTLLRGYTINGAFQLGVEDEIGSIEVGKLADMIVVEKNLFEQKDDDIHNNRVLMTMVDGQVVYFNDLLNKAVK
ncbi:MAG: amidohydrolase [Negativicutes bacterium]|jgi:hypothetical protein